MSLQLRKSCTKLANKVRRINIVGYGVAFAMTTRIKVTQLLRTSLDIFRYLSPLLQMVQITEKCPKCRTLGLHRSHTGSKMLRIKLLVIVKTQQMREVSIELFRNYRKPSIFLLRF